MGTKQKKIFCKILCFRLQVCIKHFHILENIFSSSQSLEADYTLKYKKSSVCNILDFLCSAIKIISTYIKIYFVFYAMYLYA